MIIFDQTSCLEHGSLLHIIWLDINLIKYEEIKHKRSYPHSFLSQILKQRKDWNTLQYNREKGWTLGKTCSYWLYDLECIPFPFEASVSCMFLREKHASLISFGIVRTKYDNSQSMLSTFLVQWELKNLYPSSSFSYSLDSSWLYGPHIYGLFTSHGTLWISHNSLATVL